MVTCAQTIVDNDHVWNEFKRTSGYLRIMKDFERGKVSFSLVTRVRVHFRAVAVVGLARWDLRERATRLWTWAHLTTP